MRKVKVFKYERREDDKGMYLFTDKVEVKEGLFHQFGVDYEEFDDGPGNYTTAIVEYEDGTVGNVPVDLICFVKEQP